MKTLAHNKLKNTASILIMSFFMALTVNAQEIVCPEVAEAFQNEPMSLLEEITESDYPYFLNLLSLQKYSNIVYRGLSVDFRKDRGYALTGNGKSIKLYAKYGADGTLIKGSLIKKDSRLPLLIREHLPGFMLERWEMVSNKTFINDFDPLKTEYEVELQRDNKKRTVFFDHSGNRIKRLFRS